MVYNWQQPDWPDFRYKLDSWDAILFSIAEAFGEVSGMLNAMNDEAQKETIIQMMLAEAMKTSEIEGEYLSRQDVLSSIQHKMGIHSQPKTIKDKKSRGAGQLMVEVQKSFEKPLTEKTIYTWHTHLLKHQKNINVGVWRSRN
jgi:Fic family protein